MALKKTSIPFLVAMCFLLSFCTTKGDPEISREGPDNNPGNPPGPIVDPVNPITMDQFIGANAFIDDPVDKLKAVGFIREYHNWSWDEGNGSATYPRFPNNQIQFAPSYPGWSFDDYYTNLNKEGISVAPCIQGAVSWLQGGNNFPAQHKPVDAAGLNATDPLSYHTKAFHMYQFAARYGAVKTDESQLALAPNQQKKSGLGLIKYMEDWNEQDKTWEGRAAQFTPEEYAAMASADYDGHCGVMNKYGKKYGVKNADSSMKLVMGGLASFDINYIKKMKLWFEANRKDKKFAADALNFHIYAFKDGVSWQGGGPAVSPETAGFKRMLTEIVKYRNEHLPGTEVWVSEFGWDTNPESVLSPPKIDGMDVYDVQAIWLVRAYLELAAAGVDRAQMFMSRDVDPNDKTWFSTCGLMGPKGDFTPKKSWYYVYTMKNVLKNTRYAGEIKSSNANVSIYKFKDISSTRTVYAVWARTSQNLKVGAFPIELSSAVKNARLINLENSSISGDEKALTVNNSLVRVDVTEKPVFLVTE